MPSRSLRVDALGLRQAAMSGCPGAFFATPEPMVFLWKTASIDNVWNILGSPTLNYLRPPRKISWSCSVTRVSLIMTAIIPCQLLQALGDLLWSCCNLYQRRPAGPCGGATWPVGCFHIARHDLSCIVLFPADCIHAGSCWCFGSG